MTKSAEDYVLAKDDPMVTVFPNLIMGGVTLFLSGVLFGRGFWCPGVLLLIAAELNFGATYILYLCLTSSPAAMGEGE